MGISVKTDSDTDEVVTLEWTNTEHDDTYTAQIWLSPVDGVTVVQIDTPANVGRVRVMLNDGPIWDGDPDNDAVPGAEFKNHPATGWCVQSPTNSNWRDMKQHHDRVLERVLADITRQHGDKADICSIAACEPALITAYDTKTRVRVRNTKYGYERTGIVSRTTGWQPALMLMFRSNQHGSSDLLGPDDHIVARWTGRKYEAV